MVGVMGGVEYYTCGVKLACSQGSCETLEYSGCAVLGMRQTGSRKKWLDMDSGSKNTFYHVRACWNIAGKLQRKQLDSIKKYLHRRNPSMLMTESQMTYTSEVVKELKRVET